MTTDAGAAAAATLRQLVQLRWIAVLGQLVTILAVDRGLGVPLPLRPMLLVVFSLALVNVATLVALPRHRVTHVELLLALLFDTVSLSGQLYLSGGATNPFASLYLVQVALAAILLGPWSAWVIAATAAACYAVLSLYYLPLLLPARLQADAAALFTLGRWLGFALVAILLVVFTTRISRTLRATDAHLAELRRRAAEEDGIVRVGLFASGAAHELGTPLASIAVILADWRRLPRIAADAELAGEVAEMQAEVGRCKAIVTDILHAAGQPRDEALAGASARLFLEDVVAGWRATQPAVRLAVDLDSLSGEMLATDPALRQALANLLDNAAEASPDDVELHAFPDGGELMVAVSDHGGGFAPGQLAQFGRPFRSAKGAGHGVGLFLAGNVARRLGGRLEAENRPDGAEVRLVLPLIAGKG